ncbi:DUF4124 domain-containing protein [Delftia acidovorans]|uniref:DUF4124 domain-containing protein n=1 Tax=Delftia acidovorans TaxID=80866 RepID=UPI001EDCAAE2|nr:DUF4124 domain-containing protein [Delftia acidovorans]MCG3782891.1 DUF4124 domain-containing protein [Delftia acidovorans]
MREAIALLCGLAFAVPAMAQIYQCRDPSGEMNFSDRPCSSAQVGGMIERRKTDAEILQERAEAAQANERKYRQQAVDAQRRQIDSQQRMIDQQAQQPTPASAAPGCSQARKELEFVSSIRSLSEGEERMRMNAQISNVNASCGTNMPLLQEPPKIVLTPPAGTRTVKLDRCKADSCFDIKGNLYRRYRDTLTAYNGLICLLEGDTIRCD